MSEVSNAAAAPAAPKKKAAKKTVANKETKPAKKAAPKKAATKETKKAPAAKKTTEPKAPRVKKEGLRKPQERVLQFLAKANKGMTRSEIAAGAKVDQASLTEYIGSSDDDKRVANDQKMGWPSLITLGLVKIGPMEADGKGDCYVLTAAGKKAAEKIGK